MFGPKPWFGTTTGFAWHGCFGHTQWRSGEVCGTDSKDRKAVEVVHIVIAPLSIQQQPASPERSHKQAA